MKQVLLVLLFVSAIQAHAAMALGFVASAKVCGEVSFWNGSQADAPLAMQAMASAACSPLKAKQVSQTEFDIDHASYRACAEFVCTGNEPVPNLITNY